MSDGIALLTMARSRSSMTCEIFRRHGVFFGNVWEPGERVGFNEHKELIKLAKQHRGYMYDALIRGKDPELRVPGLDWVEIMRGDGYKGGPWGVKGDYFCHEMFAGAGCVGIYRNPADIAVSCRKVFGGRNYSGNGLGYWQVIIDKHHDRMRELAVPVIDTDQLVGGDDTTLRAAFDFCDLEYDPDITRDVVIPC